MSSEQESPARCSLATGRSRLPDGGPQSAEDGVVGASEPPHAPQPCKGTKDEAIDIFRKCMIQKYERIDPSPNIIYTVESMDFNSITQVDDNVTKKEDTPIKKCLIIRL